MSFAQAVGNVTDDILVSMIISVALSTFVFWLTPDIMSIALMEVIEPRAISNLLRQAMLETEVWWYKGGCGRYFRTKTLPEIARSARTGSVFKEINVLILDPTDDKLCKNYAIYKQKYNIRT